MVLQQPLPQHIADLPRFSRGWATAMLCRRELLQHGFQVMLLSLAISVVLWLLRPQIPLLGQMAYSLSIGLLNWLMIDGGRFFVDQDSPYLFPRGWRGLVLIVVGVVVGFLLGSLLGDLLNGYSTWQLIQRSRGARDTLVYIFMFSMASGTAITLYYYQSGKNAWLQAQMEVASRQASEAQLKLLQSQLDPHMLFNTLANLRALIQSEPDRAVQMLDQLNDFLRATLKASRASEHALQAEFDRLRDYLSLMQTRMGARLHFTLDLPAELAQHKVPALILQSVVENAIVHGLEPKVEGGQVRVSAAQDGNMLVLQVQDDGLGCATAEVQEGFGLAQVRERLHSRYGEAATIDLIAETLDSFPTNGHFSSQNASKSSTSGCQVTLRIPLTPTTMP
jgi:signal transduction histidine kinase